MGNVFVGKIRFEGIRGIRLRDFLPHWTVCTNSEDMSSEWKIFYSMKEAEAYSNKLLAEEDSK